MSQIHILVHTKDEGTWPKDKKFYINMSPFSEKQIHCIIKKNKTLYLLGEIVLIIHFEEKT